MKKIITVCLLLVTLTMFGQDKDTKSFIDKTKETIGEYVDTDTVLSNVKDIEGLFVHYVKEATEGTKSLVGSTIEVAEKAVTLLLEESTIVVKQFLIYTAITHLIPILFGIFLIFWLPKLITKKFSINKDVALAHNLEVDNDESIYKKTKKLESAGNYFDSKLSVFGNSVGVYLTYLCGAYLIFLNIMPFIKVTFFSKLYLVEMLLKYI